MLREGDIVATYDGGVSPGRIGAATIEKINRDDYTPGGHVTLWTTMGRFDVPDDSTVDVLAWAPMPANRAAVTL